MSCELNPPPLCWLNSKHQQSQFDCRINVPLTRCAGHQTRFLLCQKDKDEKCSQLDNQLQKNKTKTQIINMAMLLMHALVHALRRVCSLQDT